MPALTWPKSCAGANPSTFPRIQSSIHAKGQLMKAFHEVRNYDSDFKVWCSSYTNISFLAHWHKEIEMIYIRSGSAQFSVTDHIFTAHAGDLVICDSGEIHYSDSFSCENVLDFLIFDPNIIRDFYESANFVHPLVSKKELAHHQLTALLEEIFLQVEHELSTKEAHYQEIIRARLKELWFRLKRILPTRELKTQANTKRTAMLLDLQKLLSYMEKHCDEDITLPYAAQKMSFSESHFSKFFKKMTGLNFVTYMNVVRIEHAAKELATTPNKITDIALNAGFHNIRNFNRVFREITGITPSEFIETPTQEDFFLKYYKRKSMDAKIVQNASATLIQNQPTSQIEKC